MAAMKTLFARSLGMMRTHCTSGAPLSPCQWTVCVFIDVVCLSTLSVKYVEQATAFADKQES